MEKKAAYMAKTSEITESLSYLWALDNLDGPCSFAVMWIAHQV